MRSALRLRSLPIRRCRSVRPTPSQEQRVPRRCLGSEPWLAGAAVQPARPAWLLGAQPSRPADCVPFDFNKARHINWYPGHMAKAVHVLQGMLKGVKVILEVRDGRVPFTSANPMLHQILAGKHRIVLLNKADLIDRAAQRAVSSEFARRGQPFLWVEATRPGTLAPVVPMIERAIPRKFRTLPTVAIVVGYPNTGKSSVINGLRHLSGTRHGSGSVEGKKSAVAKTGALPGITKHISGILVQNDPPILLMDTPGIMMPRFEPGDPGIEAGLKLALVSCIKEHLSGGPVILADYLRDLLNCRPGRCQYPGAFGLTERARTIDELLEAVIQKIGRCKGGTDKTISPELELATATAGSQQCNNTQHIPTNYEDKERAARFFLKKFRAGELGLVLLDNLPAPTVPSPLQNSSMRSVAELALT
eukprot:gb/GEZN01008892.1/.p1 GENE.gb/GEZN01008892.1/~~gb/GEZN01008892.1/.p1  ORF type:complete len:419 (-),score=29.00 gb/GEZN01008892.1/:16-1272(-)